MLGLRIHSLPLARLFAAVTFLLPCCPCAASAFTDRILESPRPASDSATGPFAAVARWGGCVFIHHDLRTWWSADAGKTWKSHGWIQDTPKGPVPILDGGWFTRTGPALWLGNRNGSLAFRYDPALDDWVAAESLAGTIAAAGSGDRLLSLSADHVLRASRDAGVTWVGIPLPDSVRVGTFFDDMLADGDRLVLRVRDRDNSQPAAATLDGGKTWTWLPAHAAVVLARGCVYALQDGILETICVGIRARTAAPFVNARALFADTAGAVFAWADSALYQRDPGAQATWTLIATKADLEGWSLRRDVLFCLRAESLSWFTGQLKTAVGIRAIAPITRQGIPRHHETWCLFRGRIHDLSGRRH